MRKHFIAVIIAVITCLTALSGCGALGGMEKDAYVVFEVDGKYVDGVTVNAFNNAIAPVFDETAEGAVPEGYKFMGWSAKTGWKYGDDRSVLISNGGIVRYDAVKDYLNEGGTAVVRPVIIDKSTIYRADLVIAWYDLEKTSGINQGHMDDFEVKLRSYLSTEGYAVDEMDIVIRGYNGNVGTSCENIRKDDDVDIMVGWAGNITSTGGMTSKHVKENVSGVGIGTINTRYAARLTDSELTILVYKWIQNEYGKGVVEPKPEPNPDDPVVQYDLIIAWYDLVGTSGLDSTVMGAFETKLNSYLAEQGHSDKKVLLRGYDGDVATSCGNIKTHGDVNIMVGWGGNITSKGGMTQGTDFIENVDGVTIGSKENRYATRITDDELTILVYKWIQNEYGKGVVEPEPEPNPDDPVVQYDLVIAWYDLTKTSGLDATIISNFETGLNAYLAEQGYTDKKVLLRAYDGDVATSCGKIKTDGDVDIMLGWGGDISSTGGMTEGTDYAVNQSGVAMGGKTRYVTRITDTELCNLVFTWITGGGAAEYLAAVAA